VLLRGPAWIELSWLRISKALNLKGEIVGQAFLPAFCPNGNRERLPYKTGVPFAKRFCQGPKKSQKKDLRVKW
jgi:hypothetical protein